MKALPYNDKLLIGVRVEGLGIQLTIVITITTSMISAKNNADSSHSHENNDRMFISVVRTILATIMQIINA